MKNLVAVTRPADIPQILSNTPVASLLAYHNFEEPFEVHEKAEILIGMCMDHRKSLRIPKNFAFILRTGGGNLRYNEFHLSYALAVAGVSYVVLMAHNRCAMVNLISKKNAFIEGLIKNAGWDQLQAEEYFMHFAPYYEIDNEIDFVLAETSRLQKKYPGIHITPLYYNLDDDKIYLIST